MFESAEDFVQAARRIHRAGSVDDIATELARLVSRDAPRNTVDWQERRIVRAGVRSELEHLKLAFAQHHAGSAEQAMEFRRHVRGVIHDMLASVLSAVARAEYREGLEQIAEAAVSAVVGRRTSADALRAAASGHAGEPVAYASLNGSLFIPARARKFADEFGLDEETFKTTIAEAAQPLRAACRAHGVCRVGQLRYSFRLPGKDLLLRASLDESTEDAHGPVIRILLINTNEDVVETPRATPRYGMDEARQSYSARVLRQLVS